MRNKRLAALLVFAILAFWATSSWAAAIGEDSTFTLARTLVLPEDGTGGIAAADALQFNTGFTLTAFFGHVAFFCRCIMEAVR